MFEMTDEQKEYIKLYYPIKYPKDIAEKIGVDKDMVKEFALQEGLKKVKKNTYIIEGKKMCGRCDQWVELEKFHKSNNSKKHPSGYQDWCISCYKEYVCDPKNKDRFEKYRKLDVLKKAKDEVLNVEKATSSVKVVCKICNEEKMGKEFTFKKKELKRDTVCRECRNKIARDNKIKRLKLEVEE